jgi:hypothetical protein
MQGMDSFKTQEICLNDWHWVGSLLLTRQENLLTLEDGIDILF